MARPIRPRKISEHQAALVRMIREIEVSDMPQREDVIKLLNDVLAKLTNK